MARRREPSIAESIAGLFVFGMIMLIKFIIEYWQIICIIIFSIIALVLVIKFFKFKEEDNTIFELKREIIEKDRTIKDIKNSQQVKKVKIEKTPDNKPKNEVKKVKEEYKPEKISLTNCKKEDILSISGFTEENAKQFINDRKSGYMWYNVEQFAQYFGITQPHQILDIETRVVFPARPKNKNGRKVDF